MTHQISPSDTQAWRGKLLTSAHAIAQALDGVKTIAVIGFKPAETDAPAFYVAEYAQQAGYTIIPVPVYYPQMTTALGQTAYQSLGEVPEPVDCVLLFRRPADIPSHLDEILTARPRLVWMQLGIAHPQVAETLARAGIEVVQDRCMLVELKRMGR